MAAERHSIAIDGATAAFLCGEDSTILIAMEHAGVRAIPIGCRGGGCGFCRVRVLSGCYRTGRMSRAHVSAEEAQSGYALACRLFPLGDMRLALATQVKTVFGARSIGG